MGVLIERRWRVSVRRHRADPSIGTLLGYMMYRVSSRTAWQGSHLDGCPILAVRTTVILGIDRRRLGRPSSQSASSCESSQLSPICSDVNLARSNVRRTCAKC